MTIIDESARCATFVQSFNVRGEMLRRFLAFADRTPILCIKVPTADPDALALIGVGPYFNAVFGPECMAICIGPAPHHADNQAPLNELAEWLRGAA
jgi:hypothetical protein